MKLLGKKKNTEKSIRSFEDVYKIFYPIGERFDQYDSRTPNELFPGTIWECRGKLEGIVPWWVRIK